MINIVGKRYWYFILSGLVLAAGMLSLAIFGLRQGIDFSGGSMLTVKFEQPVDSANLRQEMVMLGHPEAVIQRIGGDSFIIRTKEIGQQEKKDAEGEVIEKSEKGEIEDALKAKFGEFSDKPGFDSIGASIAREIGQYALIAILVASIGILFYIWWAFRQLPSPFRYGTCAIIALAHDALVVLGVFSILGRVINIEINAMFITGVLMIIGYSVNDTIVVFDRIRENLTKGTSRNFEVVVNSSLVQTLGRSLNTSLTSLIVLLALYIFGGVAIRDFILVLIIGVISGTYSSIFVASQVLVVWEKNEIGRLLKRI